jgi:hypothetical protein
VIDANAGQVTHIPLATGTYAYAGTPVIGPDGTAYVVSYAGNGAGYTYKLTAIDPDQPVQSTTVTLPSYPTGAPAFAPDGTAYFVTLTPGSTSYQYRSHVTIIDPADPASAVTIDLESEVDRYYGSAVLTATDDVALVSSYKDITVIRRSDPTNTTTITVPGADYYSGSVVEDGVAYLTATSYEYVSGQYQYITSVLVVDAADPEHPAIVTIAGRPAGTVIVGDDGTVVQPVVDDNVHTVSLAIIKKATASASTL